MALFVGLMSGTSLDGVDAVLAAFPESGGPIVARGHTHVAMPVDLRQELLALNAPGSDELHRAALAANRLMDLYAAAVEQLLEAAGVRRDEVRALGAHGQTVRHRPREFDGIGYTLQLVNGARLAELTAIDSVVDFRSRDVAAGGQGAPLAPAFHFQVFRLPDATSVVLNIGGIANLTALRPGGEVSGFDCGPGNVLLDLWCSRHLGAPFDRDGQWAAAGRVAPDLLDAMLADPYFSAPPPKSTGRDHFNEAWLARCLALHAATPTPDVMATLAELTAMASAQAVRQAAPGAEALWVCGGGAFNSHLMQRLRALLPGVHVGTTAERGVPPDHVEALAFAWLAREHVNRRPGNLPAVTGARGPRLLGTLYPA